MAEHLSGQRCLHCPQVITLPVDICDVHDDEDVLVDVSVEVDMNPWYEHAAEHRGAGHGLYGARA